MWFYKGSEFTGPSENDYGFVYIITNLQTNKQYIGKKLFWHKKTKTLKGKKKRYLAESDWKTYYGSSKELSEDIKLIGKELFKREIIHLCSSKGECSYKEAKEQFERGVLLNSELFYNDWIIVRVHRRHLSESRSG
jgi:hypothetical protein